MNVSHFNNRTMITLKLIKKKDFAVDKAKHVHYTTAYKGRVIAVSTLNIDAADITADDTAMTLAVKGDFDLVNRSWADPITGEARIGLVLLPKMDIAISAF